MQKKILFNLIIVSLSGIILTTIVLFLIQTLTAHVSIDKSFSVRLSDVEARMHLNKLQIAELTEATKDDYISRAKALSFMIELDPEIVNDREKLNEAVLSLGVDEVHIIDENGLLWWGTQPQYYGMDFASTEQTRPFLAILEDPSLEIAQDPMPNGSIGLMRQYAGVSLRNKKGIAQIGMAPERLEKALKNNDIENVLSAIRVGNNGYVFSVSPDTGIITSHPNVNLIGTRLSEPLKASGFATIDGTEMRYGTRLVEGELLVAVIPKSELYAERTFFTSFFLCFMFLIFGAFSISLSSYMKGSVIAGILETVDTLEKISSGNLDVTANVRSNEEFIKLSDGINHMLASINAKIEEIASLADDRERLGAIVAIADAGIIVKDKEGLITDWNAGATNILGYSPEEIIGNSTKYYAPDSSHADIDIFQELLAKGEHIEHVDVVRKHKDGRLIDCSASYSPVIDEYGNYNGSVAIFHDVTEKKLVEKKAQSLGAIVTVADAGFVVRDKDFKVIEWNVGAENILGYKPEEIVGKDAKYYVPEEGYDEVERINRCLLDGEHTMHVEVVRRHKDGRLIDCSASYTPIFDDEGRFTGSVAIFHDISDKKQMERELEAAVVAAEEASNIKSTFLANMSHEIRTPMNAVIGMADLLLSEQLAPNQRRFAADIKTSGTNLLGIINNILDLSKIEAGKFEIVPVDYNFISMLENTDSIFTFIAQSKNIEYVSEKSGALPYTIYGDDIRLKQVLTNLLSNAVKFTSQGHVKLKTWVDTNNVYFDVSDTGTGIKPEDMSKLFDAFQQVNLGVTRNKVGTGLGLSISKSIIETMGGTITVESEYGKGSVFHVQVPFIEGDPEKIQTPPETYSFITAPDANILVVDDFDMNLNVAAGLLRLSGIECDTAIGGAQAIELIKKKKYDIVFMDHMMPVMDGMEATKRIREMGFDKSNYPIIALTANAIEGVRDTLIGCGMNDFLSKPIDRVLLNEMLIKWLPPEKVYENSNSDINVGTESNSSDNDVRKLKETGALDVDAGLALMGGSEKTYKDTLRIIIRRIPELVGAMAGYLENGQLDRFAIDIHGIKSSLASIGASELSKQASVMEKSAIAKDADFCVKMFPGFSEGLLALYEKLHPIFFAAASEPPEQVGAEGLLRQLEDIKKLLAALEDDAALDILSRLKKLDFGQSMNDMINTLYDQIEMFEFENAGSTLSILINLVNKTV